MEDRRRTCAALVIASAALLATACGQSNSGASAPTTTKVAAGQSAPAAAASTPEANPNFVNLSVDNFPFKGPDGKIYEGLAAFQKAHELSADNYTGDNFQKLLPAVINQLNQWISAGADPQTESAYANYTGPKGVKGASAVAHFYDQAFTATLSNSSSFTDLMTTKHGADVDEFRALQDMSVVYKSEFQATQITYVEGNGVAQYDIALREVDNVPGGDKKPASAIRMTMKQSAGSDGRPVWKIIDWSPSPAGQ